MSDFLENMFDGISQIITWMGNQSILPGITLWAVLLTIAILSILIDHFID